MGVWPAPLSALPLGFSRPERNSWFLTHSPLPVTLLFVFYLLLGVAGPHIMSQLEPLRLAGSLAPTTWALRFSQDTSSMR